MLSYQLNNEWQEILICPNCGSKDSLPTIQKMVCSHCQYPLSLDENSLSWGMPEKSSSTEKRNHLFRKLKNQCYPMSSVFLPFRYISAMRDQQYYRRTLSDKSLALKWAKHYLHDLNLKPGDNILDHGCGRGRLMGLANQIGLNTFGQDIEKHAWWKNLTNSTFQAIPADCARLPWQNELFSAVFNFGVFHHFNETALSARIQEIFRVLKPGGYLVMLEANDEGYAARMPFKYCGRLHSLHTVRTLGEASGFTTLALSYEGFYAPIFPLLINFIRKTCARDYDPFDFGSRIEVLTPPKRRALWLLKMQKPF